MLPRDPLSERILGCVFKVSSGLGIGFVEKVYENALVHELRKPEIRRLVPGKDWKPVRNGEER